MRYGVSWTHKLWLLDLHISISVRVRHEAASYDKLSCLLTCSQGAASSSPGQQCAGRRKLCSRGSSQEVLCPRQAAATGDPVLVMCDWYANAGGAQCDLHCCSEVLQACCKGIPVSSRHQTRTELSSTLQETELDWPVAMAAATAADKSAMAAAAAGEEAAQLAVRRYVFEGMAPQHWPQAAAAPSQSGSKPCSKPRSRMPLVRLPSRQAARQVKPMPMRTLSSDAAFESALQLATAQAKVPAIKRPPPPPSSYHAHSAAPDIAPQQAPALQPPKAPQQHPSVRMQKHVPPPATASLQSGPQLPAQGPPSTAGETVSDALPPPPPPPPPPPQRPRQAAMTQQLSLAPQQQPQQVVQDGTLQAIMAMLDSKLPPAAQGSPSAAGWTLTIDGITLYILPTSQPPASAGQLEPQQPPANTTCHFEMQPRLLPRSVPDYSWQEKVFMNMNHWFTIAAKDQATRASQRQKNRCLAGAREYREEAMPKPRWR